MREDYSDWLIEQKYSEGTQNNQLHRVKKVENSYGDLDGHFNNGTYDKVVASLQYSTQDERLGKPNPSKIKFDGNIRNNLQSYKNAVVGYKRFLMDDEFLTNSRQEHPENYNEKSSSHSVDETSKQRFTLERDMQAALRRNIESLNPDLIIIDDGAERAVDSGSIDITCKDKNGIVVIELKAGKADSRSIGQILGYMGDISEEENGCLVRGILVASDFDKRVKSAAGIVPNLTLQKYSIEFVFLPEG